MMRALWRALGAGVLALALAFAVQVALSELPELNGLPAGSVRLLDRSGQELALVRDGAGELSLPIELADVSPWLVPALLAAEDARFYRHPGVDPLAMVRAAAAAVRHGRIVSGASTLTQQLARTCFERPRTLWGKWRELALAIRLELAYDKAELLEAYLNRVHFGPRHRGIGAASRAYFDKPARALSLAEAATLVALVRGPTRYDPLRHPERLRRRRDWILERMLALGWAPEPAVSRARAAPIALHEAYVAPGAFHFVRAVSSRLERTPSAESSWRSTLDARLQAQVESLVRRLGPDLTRRHGSNAAAVIVDNASGAVRAYIGSVDYWSERWLGQNDGALALRQPGSTLKPFVYAFALSELGLSTASVLADLERDFPSPEGHYTPHNYDRRFHGPVRLGQALAASLNLPAVALAEQLGPERVAAFLGQLGFEHLAQAEPEYGPGIALGAVEVQLVELVQAYATLARGGTFLPLRWLEDAPLAEPRRVLSQDISRQIIGVLSDPRERAASFARGGPLEFDFPVAVKTGTSKGNRDNWVIGSSHELTAGVWVGNFDGSPMLRSSGVSGAGPLFHAVLSAAQRELGASEPNLPEPANGVVLDICAASGLLAGPHCPHVLRQSFATPVRPAQSCSWHSRSCPDAGQACDGVEALPARYAAWAHDSGRSVALNEQPSSPAAEIEIVSPRAGARLVIDGNLGAERQEIVLSARSSAPVLSFVIDGRELCRVGPPFRCAWRLQRGRHQLSVVASGGAHASRELSVQ